MTLTERVLIAATDYLVPQQNVDDPLGFLRSIHARAIVDVCGKSEIDSAAIAARVIVQRDNRYDIDTKLLEAMLGGSS